MKPRLLFEGNASQFTHQGTNPVLQLTNLGYNKHPDSGHNARNLIY